MPVIPTGFIRQADLDAEVSRAVSKLGPEVLRVKHVVQPDTGGDPAIYFRIILTDSATRSKVPGDTTQKIRALLNRELQPRERWDLIPHFNFRTESEQAALNDPMWS